MDIKQTAKAIEEDAGMNLPDLEQSLNEMKKSTAGRVYTPDQLLVIEARKATKLSQKNFSMAIDTPIGTYRDWEQGRFKSIPGAVKTLLKLIKEKPEIIAELSKKTA